MGTFRELSHRRDNQKIKTFACSVIRQCEAEKFTVADMKDLAKVFPEVLNEAIISEEEKTLFNVSPNE